ncbi:hypothetical protein Tsp_08125 [Trichinella spiralis]|uniref:hypothetical protein n=1 Tax=Trichinella spiralis TaxID=6334 RepID=UPI0001EFE4AB|nr:hypothetical protein Tsp_08125 [Trichinella spiralis]
MNCSALAVYLSVQSSELDQMRNARRKIVEIIQNARCSISIHIHILLYVWFVWAIIKSGKSTSVLSQLRAQFLGAAGLGDKTMDVSKWMSRLNYPGPALEPHEMEIVQNMKYLQTSSCLKDAKKEADCLDDIGQKMEKAKFATASMDCHLTLAMDLYENIFEKANEIDQLLEPVPNALQLSNDWENYFPRLW